MLEKLQLKRRWIVNGQNLVESFTGLLDIRRLDPASVRTTYCNACQFCFFLLLSFLTGFLLLLDPLDCYVEINGIKVGDVRRSCNLAPIPPA